MLIKIYGADPQAETRYSPAKCIGAEKQPKIGNPDSKHISTSYAERSNLTMRMHMRRFTRLTNAFSKKVENHAAAIALHTMYYNFVRIHQTLQGYAGDGRWRHREALGSVRYCRDAGAMGVSEFQAGISIRGPAIRNREGHSVSVMWRGGEVDTIFGFEKEADALQWIKEKSQGWLLEKQS